MHGTYAHAHTHTHTKEEEEEEAAGAVVLMYMLLFDLHLIRAIMLVSCGGAARHERAQTLNEMP